MSIVTNEIADNIRNVFVLWNLEYILTGNIVKIAKKCSMVEQFNYCAIQTLICCVDVLYALKQLLYNGWLHKKAR